MSRDRYRRSHSHQSPPPPPPPRRNSHSNSPLSCRSGKNPPSRHLWVGNLAHGVTKSMLIDVLIRFGEIDSVAYPPGRSYAFVNYINENDAVAALDSLQGFDLAGFPLRIEFAKADKSSTPSHDENYTRHRDDQHPSSRGYISSKRDLRTRRASPEPYHPPDSTPRTENGDDHPSEILWIGFPSFLKVDETILRKAFSPFGEIEKITAFPGRPYAFVQFRSRTSACRAKETLQGRLFGNPRVHICFAKSDTPSTGGGKRGVGSSGPHSPHFKHDRRSYEEIPTSVRPPRFSESEYRDPDIVGYGRNEPSQMRGNGAYEEQERRAYDFEPHVGAQHGFHRSHEYPSRDGDGNDRLEKISPENFTRRRPLNDDPWHLPEDTNIYHGTKKPKMDPVPEEELPEYPLHILEPSKPPFPRVFPEFHEARVNVNRPIEDRHEWRASHDAYVSPPPSSTSTLEWKRMTPELHRPAPKELWKWEGTIAKGGTPVCRARCFPVGRVMDIILPEFLDCTARTGLDMLAKHYYQASGSWVVFFVPGSDTDMPYYNEFLRYLGDKQRAAVSKLDDRHTLFLVPPSDFSEKVLKVPGKLSISGVVLRLEPASPTIAPFPPPNETNNRPLMNPYVDTPYPKSETPSSLLHSLASYPNLAKPGFSGPSYEGNLSYGQANQNFSDHIENRHDVQPARAWSPHPPPRFPLQQEHDSILYEQRLPVSVPFPSSNLKPRQNQGLASSHLGQEGQFFGSSSMSSTTEEYRPEIGRGVSYGNVVGNQTTHETQSTGGGQDEAENDPQKRLQATLQLAATLLQQIQQGKN